MKRLLLAGAAVLLFGVGTAWAGATEDGHTAYQRGDYPEALKQFRLGAAQGDADAQLDIGVMYYLGKGVAQDYAEAIKWYRLAATQGNAEAQENLGLAYILGRGVPPDDAEGVKWMHLAAAQGYAPAQESLGMAYSDGRGVPQDYVRAHMWFNLSGASGDASGAEKRDLLAARMTPQQIAEAQKLARECQQHNFKGCD